MTLTGRYSLTVDVGEACGIIFLGSWKLPEVGVSSCFLLRIWLSETSNKPREARLLGSSAGVARVRDSPAHPAFLRSRGAGV